MNRFIRLAFLAIFFSPALSLADRVCLQYGTETYTEYQQVCQGRGLPCKYVPVTRTRQVCIRWSNPTPPTPVVTPPPTPVVTPPPRETPRPVTPTPPPSPTPGRYCTYDYSYRTTYCDSSGRCYPSTVSGQAYCSSRSGVMTDPYAGVVIDCATCAITTIPRTRF